MLGIRVYKKTSKTKEIKWQTQSQGIKRDGNDRQKKREETRESVEIKEKCTNLEKLEL